MSRQRNYAADYKRRIERGLARGLSRAAARGHAPKLKKAAPAHDPKLEAALLRLRKEKIPLTKLASETHVSRERLSQYIRAVAGAHREGGAWRFNDRRIRQFTIIEAGADQPQTIRARGYPTVCTAQQLWPFVIGEGFTQKDATPEIRAFVETATPEDFQRLENWPKLTALVRIKPDRDLVPIRAAYPGQKHDTIGLNFLTYRGDLWITLADCLAAKFLSGSAPIVEEAIQFTAGPPQPGLKPIKLMGLDPIDPYSQDLYRELICARQRLEAEKAGKSEAEQAEIEGAREFLKIVANSTSYGIFVQVNVSTEPRGAWIDVHRPNGSHFRKKMAKVETLGPWFNPLVATLITGGARLMLALAEYQVQARGLDWAFCDTDSIAIAKPDNMADDDFVDRCLGPSGVVEWFRPLNPYGLDEPILKVEKVNYAASGPKQLAPLYCWAISSKRYALFNVTGNGNPTVRKASAHGLGHLRSPYEDKDAPTCFPKPLKSVLSGKEKLQRWHYDVWCAILTAVLAGKPDTVKFDSHRALKDPTVSRYTATSPELLNWFKKLNGEKPYAEAIKPYGFLFTLHLKKSLHPDLKPDPILRGKKAGDVFPVAPFYRDLKIAISKAFDRVTNAPIDVALLETYTEALSEYPNRSENKFSNGEYRNSGTTERRHIFATGINLIGKEADHWEQEYYLGIRNGDVTVTPPSPVHLRRAAMSAILNPCRSLKRACSSWGVHSITRGQSLHEITNDQRWRR